MAKQESESERGKSLTTCRMLRWLLTRVVSLGEWLLVLYLKFRIRRNNILSSGSSTSMEAPSPLLAPQKKGMSMLCHLPEEMIMEILLRLPPESLIRLKCICKSWYGLIGDPSFVVKHLHFTKNKVSSSTSLFLSWQNYKYEDEGEGEDEVGEGDGDEDEDEAELELSTGYEDVRCLVTIFHRDDAKDINDQIPCVIEYLDVSSMISGMENKDFLTVSHCNGIICLAGYSIHENILFNPTMKEFKCIPRRFISEQFIKGEGFGYDSKANDYKFIRIWGLPLLGARIAEVYTLASNSWRQIPIDMEVGYCKFDDGGLCCKGVLYWLLMKPDSILSFDLSTDKFHNIPLPVSDMVEDPFMKAKVIVTWNESAALLIQDYVSSSIEMWVMSGYHGGVKGSWIKMSTIRPMSSLYYPIMFWKSDELLMVTKDGGIVSYNLGTQKFRSLPIHGVSPTTFSGDFYMKSLVSVN